MVGCKKCSVFAICPLKTVIGDYKKPEKDTDQYSKKQKK